MTDDILPEPEPSGVEQAAPFTDKIDAHLVPQEAPNFRVLIDLVQLIREAQKKCDAAPPPKQAYRKPQPGEQFAHQDTLNRVLGRIDQIAAASEEKAQRLKAKVQAEGPNATAQEVAAAEQAIHDAVAWLNEQGLHVRAKELR